METYLKDELINKCSSAATHSKKKLLEIMSPEEIREIDISSVWTKCRKILADEQLKKKDRLKLAMTVGEGAMKIRGEKLKLMQKNLNSSVKKIEQMDDLVRLNNMEHEEPKIDIEKLLEMPDFELKFPTPPEDRNLLSDSGEEMNLLHTGKDSESGFSFSEDLSQNMRDFEEFISHQRVAKGQQSQGENNQGGGNIDLAIGARSDLNMEVDENATAADVTIPGTPSKRLGSVIRGDDTPSKRGRFSSRITDSRKEQDHEESSLQGVSGINPLDTTDQEVGSQPEAEQEQLSEINRGRQMREEEEELVVREPGVDPTRVRRQRGWDEVTTLSDKWFKDFPKRTKAYMKSTSFNELREGIPTKPLAAAKLLKMPGFPVQNKNLRKLFDQNFNYVIHVVEPEEEGENRSPQRSPQRREEIQEQEQEQVRDQPDISHLIESRQEIESDANVDETIDRRVSISPSSALGQVPVPSTPEVPYQSAQDSGNQLQFPDTSAQGLSGAPDDFVESHDGYMGITEETILAQIFDLLTFEDREFLDIKEVIPPESNNEETAAWSFYCLLELKMKKKIELSQENSKASIHISIYKE